MKRSETSALWHLASARRVVLSVLVLAELAALTTNWSIFSLTAQASFVVLCVIALPWVTIREQSLFAVAFLLTIYFLGQNGDPKIIGSALDLAAFFGSFILLISVMKEAAQRSVAVQNVGHFLTSQPPGRRFYATAIGGHLLGVFLNFAAVSLMSPLIQKSAVTADGTPDKALERRQLSALIRGFSWILLWAPTTLSQAVLLTIFTDVAWSDFVWLGIASAILMTVIGRFYDRLEWPERRASGSPRIVVFPARDFCVVSGVCAVLIGATFAGRWLFGASIATSLIFVAPVVTIFWFIAQTGNDTPPKTPLQRAYDFGPILRDAAPSLGRSAIALGLSGYLGRISANILPADDIANVLALDAIPGWMFLAILPIVINLGGQIALSPILLVVFLGEVLKNIPNLPADNVGILFALSAGWALSMMASPNATATLLISSVTQIPPTTLTWRWNLRCGFVCYLAFVGIFIVIA